MKKIIVIAVSIILSMSSFALACSPKPDPQPTTTTVNVSPTAGAAAQATAHSSAGAAAMASQTNNQLNNQQTDISVNPTNTNRNSQSTATTVNQTVEAAQNYLEGPALIQSRPALASGRADDSKTFGIFLKPGSSYTAEEASILAGDSHDVKVRLALITAYDYKNVGSIKVGTVGTFMGYLYANPAGPGATQGNMEGAAMKAALYAGATSMKRVHRSIVEVSTGTVWNVGIGGGASMTAGGNGTAIAPNGGTGYGSASAHNELLPSAVYALYCDKQSLKEVHYEIPEGCSGH